jgi:hypothetical protein
MLRGILSLALISLAAAGGQCELDSSAMVEDGINGALAIWASTKRCHGAWLSLSPVKCEQDIATSIQVVTHMAGSIAGMVQSCHQSLVTENHECALAANALVSATAGLAAASGLIADKCAHVAKAPKDGGVLGLATDLGSCTADAGGSMNSLFHASNSLQNVKKHCAKGLGQKHCAMDALDAVGVLSSFGAAIAAAVSDCSAYHDKTAPPSATTDTAAASCANGILSAVAQLTEVAEQGVTLKRVCEAPAARLYLEGHDAATSGALPFALAAALPITAVLSFALGKRVAKSRQQTAADDTELGIE